MPTLIAASWNMHQTVSSWTYLTFQQPLTREHAIARL